MRLSLLISVLCLVWGQFLNGQSDNTQTSTGNSGWSIITTDYNKNESRIAVFTEFGIAAPISLGDSFVREAQSMSLGYTLGIDAILFDYVLFGLNYYSFKSSTTDKEIVGNISSTRFNYGRIKLGGRLPFNERWAVDLSYQFIDDSSIVQNVSGGDGRFNDFADHLSLQGRLNYWLNRSFVAYFSLDYFRIDFKTEVPQQIQRFYESETILSPSLGIALKF